MARNLLLVADAEWVRNDVAATIVDPDLRLDVLRDPTRVLETATGGLFDLYVVDMQVGAMGGMAVTRDLKNAMLAGDVTPAPVILLLDRTADAFLARRARADRWLVKPFNPRDLQRLVDEMAPAPVG